MVSLFDIYTAILLIVLIIATFSKKDFWPFSNYPMFSKERKIAVCRIAFELEDGKMIWWKAPFHHLQQNYANRFYHNYSSTHDKLKRLQLIASLFKITGVKQQDARYIIIYERLLSDNQSMQSVNKEVFKVDAKSPSYVDIK